MVVLVGDWTLSPHMRFPTLEDNFWHLISGEEMHDLHPDTFWIPDPERRATLKRGDAAKLIFEVEAEDPGDGTVERTRERMWVIVSEALDDGYIGVLDSDPTTFDTDEFYLAEGVEVPFRPEHVIGVDRPPDEYVEARFRSAPKRSWPRT